jgi:hypothetical protein
MKAVGIIEQCIRLRIRPELTIRRLLEMPQHELDALTERMHELATAGNVLDDIVKPTASSLPIMITVIGVDGRAHYLDERHGFTLCACKVDRRAHPSLDADVEGCSECLGKWCEILRQHLGKTTEGKTMAEQKAVELMFDTQRFAELITRYSGTLSTLIADQARKGIRRHREDLLYLEKWGIDETERSGRSIDDLNSEKVQRIDRLKEQLELAELLATIDLAGFSAAMAAHFSGARQES